ncbi:unnamed protein product [Durusdinium trenchii]|uniref:Calpain catalytic domain-containing protein n=1 Tax=Durusdinium trenchii TaxID=1381693 RepID=A0ABP0MYQ4_9DINO
MAWREDYKPDGEKVGNNPDAAQRRLERLYQLLRAEDGMSLRLQPPKPLGGSIIRQQLAQLTSRTEQLELEKQKLRGINSDDPENSNAALQQHIRDMLLEQRRLVEELQREIAQEIAQAKLPPPQASPRLAPREMGIHAPHPEELDSPRLAPQEDSMPFNQTFTVQHSSTPVMFEPPRPAYTETARGLGSGQREGSSKWQPSVLVSKSASPIAQSPSGDLPELRVDAIDFKLKPYDFELRRRAWRSPPSAAPEQRTELPHAPQEVEGNEPELESPRLAPPEESMPRVRKRFDSGLPAGGSPSSAKFVAEDSSEPPHAPLEEPAARSDSGLPARGSPSSAKLVQEGRSEPQHAPQEESGARSKRYDSVLPARGLLSPARFVAGDRLEPPRAPQDESGARMKVSHPEVPVWGFPSSASQFLAAQSTEPPHAPREVCEERPKPDHSVPAVWGSPSSPSQLMAEQSAEPPAAPREDSEERTKPDHSVPAVWGSPSSPSQLMAEQSAEPPAAPREDSEERMQPHDSELPARRSMSPASKPVPKQMTEHPRAPRERSADRMPDQDPDTHHLEDADQPPAKATPAERPLSKKVPVQGEKGASSGHDDEGKSAMEWQKQQLADGIVLLKRWVGFEHTCLQLRVSNKKLSDMKFTVNIASSLNLEFEKPPAAKGKTSCCVTAMSATETDICYLQQVEHGKAAKLSLAFSWEPLPLDRKQLQALNEEDERRQRDIVTRLKQKGITTSQIRSAAKIQDACKAHGFPRFVDAEFMPTDSSLFEDPTHQNHPPVIWKRPEDFCKGSVRIFSDDIAPSDIKQGALGDCWFLAALAAMAEEPDLVHRVFANNGEANEQGVYEISCFKNGRPTTIVVDDFLPCSPNTGKPCYAHVDLQGRNANELWVMLLEKAWAKLHGSYERIESGMPYRALMDLLGAAGKEYHLETEKKPDGLVSKDKFFSMLCRYDEAGYLMVAGTPGSDTFTKGDKSKTPLSGLIPGHAYTLLSAHEAKGVRLLKLRNPWGDHEWTGDWSDKSSLWTQPMKDAFHPSFDANDGEFWMCERDFLSHFSSVGVCFISDSWATSRTALSSDVTDLCSQLVCIKTVAPIKKGFISLIQEDTRIKGAPSYTQLSFALYGPVVDGKPKAEVLRSHLWPVRELVEEIPHEKPLPAGEYWVAVFTPDKVPDRPLTLVLQLDAQHSQVTTRAVDDRLRESLALASALTGNPKPLGPASSHGAWLPNGGYAFAVSCPQPGVVMSFDFAPCKGLALRGKGSKVEMSFKGQETKLVGELQPLSNKKSFSVSTSCRMPVG